MAQEEGGGHAPRKTTTYNKFEGMNSQDGRYGVSDNEMFWLENIMRIAPHKLHSVPGPGLVISSFPPVVPPPGCLDTTERGQQHLTIEDRFVQSFGVTHTSWGYITAEEEVYTLVGDAVCGGGNMSYSDLCCQLNHFNTPAIVTHPPLIDPDNLQAAVNSKVGTSDQPVYGYNSNTVGGAGVALYYPLLGTHVDYLMPVTDYDGFRIENFVINGDSVFFTGVNDAVSFNQHREVLEYNRLTGDLLNRYTTIDTFHQLASAATADFLYVLCQSISDANDYSIKKLDRSDGTLAATFQLDNINPAIFGVVNDDLIYVLCGTAVAAALYYVKNFSTLTFVGHMPLISSVNPFSNNGFFTGSAVYWGGSGSAGSIPDIFRIIVECPDGSPTIASVDRGSDSVAAGGTINASWADVLEPDALDEIQLRPAPTGGDLGFVGAALASQVTDGTGTGSLVFTIPGGTPPGDYVFMYAAIAGVYVATSPTFTVT